MELSYLEVGLGSQSIHMEFDGDGPAYTLLVRDSLRCKRFFGLLTGNRCQLRVQNGKLLLLKARKTHKSIISFSIFFFFE